MRKTRKVQLTVTTEVDRDVSDDELAEAVLDSLADDLRFAHSVEVEPAGARSSGGRLSVSIRVR